MGYGQGVSTLRLGVGGFLEVSAFLLWIRLGLGSVWGVAGALQLQLPSCRRRSWRSPHAGHAGAKAARDRSSEPESLSFLARRLEQVLFHRLFDLFRRTGAGLSPAGAACRVALTFSGLGRRCRNQEGR